MINNPRYYGGAMGPVEADKAMRLVPLCDTFHLPLVWLWNEPGFHVGPDNEVRGLLRGGARAVTVFAASRMPYMSFIMRQCHGVAGGLHVRHSGMYPRYASPFRNAHALDIENLIDPATPARCSSSSWRPPRTCWPPSSAPPTARPTAPDRRVTGA